MTLYIHNNYFQPEMQQGILRHASLFLNISSTSLKQFEHTKISRAGVYAFKLKACYF